ncbi:hypothetical protein [Microbacterium marinilacus]|uniref:Uncharacterized protein n=1 Tax=Microbacterium marinilacus TaxID=415209 RepID=A0ABP7B4D9_9MICO|nr:hypothetical protein [Microbacterium marinilacus]MBY0687915.1 hypothetical protein [Microbacterium marinilacus]
MTVPTAPEQPAGDGRATLGEVPAQPELFAWSDALHAPPGWEQKSSGSAPGSYDEKLAATRQVIAAARSRRRGCSCAGTERPEADRR